MFTFVYLVMPNTKVKLRSASTAGIMAGTIFVLFQLAYVFIQSRRDERPTLFTAAFWRPYPCS